MAVLVESQGALLETIEYNVNGASSTVYAANIELRQASYGFRSRRRKVLTLPPSSNTFPFFNPSHILANIHVNLLFGTGCYYTRNCSWSYSPLDTVCAFK